VLPQNCLGDSSLGIEDLASYFEKIATRCTETVSFDSWWDSSLGIEKLLRYFRSLRTKISKRYTVHVMKDS
jgi:hypothetical protein